MRDLDKQEKKIIRELIKNPRISDNKIANHTGIPVMSVNRKRKKLEGDKLLRYYTSIDKGEFGLNIFGAKQLYTIKFKAGITRNMYLKIMETDNRWRLFNSTFISQAYLGEKDGHLALVMILDAKNEADLVDEFNGNVIAYLQKKLGEDCIKRIDTCALSQLVRVHHNYMPAINMKNGILDKEWPNEMIFVDEPIKDTDDLQNFL